MSLFDAFILGAALNGYPYRSGRRRTVTRTKTVVINRSHGKPIRTVTKRTTVSRGRDPYYLNGGFFRY